MAPADVHGTLGGIYGCLRNLRGPAKSANEPSGCGMETLTDFDGFLWIPTGVRRILAGFCGAPRFSGGCVRMLAQLL